MKTNYLVCYDIADPRRLARVYRKLGGTGLHLQYSVFLCRLSWQELKTLKYELAGLIDDEEDDIRIYPLPSTIRVEVIGRGDMVPEGVDIFL